MALVKITPETLKTIYLRTEDGTILKTEENNRISVEIVIPPNFKPYRIYELEQQKNENKREILLVDRDYLNQITKEFEQLIRDLDVWYQAK